MKLTGLIMFLNNSNVLVFFSPKWIFGCLWPLVLSVCFLRCFFEEFVPISCPISQDLPVSWIQQYILYTMAGKSPPLACDLSLSAVGGPLETTRLDYVIQLADKRLGRGLRVKYRHTWTWHTCCRDYTHDTAVRNAPSVVQLLRPRKALEDYGRGVEGEWTINLQGRRVMVNYRFTPALPSVLHAPPCSLPLASCHVPTDLWESLLVLGKLTHGQRLARLRHDPTFLLIAITAFCYFETKPRKFSLPLHLFKSHLLHSFSCSPPHHITELIIETGTVLLVWGFTLHWSCSEGKWARWSKAGEVGKR